MKTYNELIEASKKALASAESIEATAKAEDRDLTDEEVTSIEQHAKESRDLMAQADALKRRETATGSVASLKDQLKQVEPKRVKADVAAAIDDNVSQFVVRERDPMLADISRSKRSLRCFGNDQQGRMEAYAMGQWLRASAFGIESSQQWCLGNGFEYRAAMTSGAGSGGSLVPEILSTRIISLVDDYGVFAQQAYNHPMSSETELVPRRTGGVTTYAIGENEAPTESQPTFDHVELVAKQWGTLSLMPNSLIDDAIVNLGDIVATEIARANAAKQDDAGFNGDGTSTYHGIHGIRPKIITSPYTASIVDATSGDDQFSELISDDLAAMMGKLPEYVYQRGMPKWYTSRTGWANCFERLTLAAGGVTGGEMTDGAPRRAFRGYDVVLSPYMPNVTTALNNVVMILFGDLSMSTTFGMRKQIGVKVLRERYAEKDQTGIVSFTRWIINNHDLGDTTNPGPVIGITGNT